MSIEDTNKAIFRRSFEDPTFTRAEFLSPDFVDHNLGPRFQGRDCLECYKEAGKEFVAAFSDIHWTLNDLIAEGDKVVVYGTTTGTHTGMYFGKPPTGKQVTFSVITIYRLADGKVVECWDDIGLHNELEQLLAMP